MDCIHICRQHDVITVAVTAAVLRSDEESEKKTRGEGVEGGRRGGKASRRSRDKTGGEGWLQKGAVAGRDVAECGQVYWVTGSMRKPRKSDVVVEAQAQSRVRSRPRLSNLRSSLRPPSFPKVFPGRYSSLLLEQFKSSSFSDVPNHSFPSSTRGKIQW